MGFFSSIGNAFKSATKWVGKAAGSIGKVISAPVKAASWAAKATKTIGHTVANITRGVARKIGPAVNAATSIIKTGLSLTMGDKAAQGFDNMVRQQGTLLRTITGVDTKRLAREAARPKPAVSSSYSAMTAAPVRAAPAAAAMGYGGYTSVASTRALGYSAEGASYSTPTSAPVRSIPVGLSVGADATGDTANWMVLAGAVLFAALLFK